MSLIRLRCVHSKSTIISGDTEERAGVGGATTAASLCLTPLGGLGRNAGAETVGSHEPDPWLLVPSILARIKAPTFPVRDFDVTRYGAVSRFSDRAKHSSSSTVDDDFGLRAIGATH